MSPQSKPHSDDTGLEDIFNDVKDAIGSIDDYKPETVRPHQADSLKRPNIVASSHQTTFPTEMNCSQVFDQLLKCYSLGGQLRNYYRYGEISYCYDKRDKLKFCLSTKLMSDDDRKEKIKHWHMGNLAEQQSKRQTSEIVWRSRQTAFRLPFREDSEDHLNDSNN